MLETSREEATLATRLYNDPTEPRCLESFIVHMHLAWLYLLHAICCQSGTDIRYRDRKRPHLLEKVDGEAKLWDLAKCASHHFGDQSPVKANIDFFIALRNKIEHRHLRADENISLAVSGRAQALLLNYEKEVVIRFGKQWTMALVLRTPLFVGTFTADGRQTLLDLQNSIPANLRLFLTKFDGALDNDVLNSSEFDIRLNVILRSSQRGADALALEFVRVQDLTEEEVAAYEILQRRGVVVVRDRHQPVANLANVRPGMVVAQVQGKIPFVFTQTSHTAAWKRQRVRPVTGARDPRGTRQEFCIFDEAHRDYVYTPAWVTLIVESCQTMEGFSDLTGITPTAA